MEPTNTSAPGTSAPGFPRRLRRGWNRRLAVSLLALFLITACGDANRADRHLTSVGTSIVCLGDSITAGSGAAPDRSYPARLSQELGLPVVNAGVPGDTTADGLDRLRQVLDHNPWLVIVELGGNDLLRRLPADDAENNLAAILQGLSNAGVATVLVEVDPPLFGGSYDGIHRRLASRFSIPLVEAVVGEVLSDPARKSDQIHPNAAGYADIARAVARVVRPLVEERREAGLPVSPSTVSRDAA